ncbi:MAG: hypothetical protein GX493_08545 [Firmicutes bacterium]|nr:hypothetical protein [Bacillota bacterium]
MSGRKRIFRSVFFLFVALAISPPQDGSWPPRPNPAKLRGRLEAEAVNALLGLVPFTLLEMPGVSLSNDFTENSPTAAINAGFQPADQGRLAAVLREMGIADAGQMDLTAAKELATRRLPVASFGQHRRSRRDRAHQRQAVRDRDR